MEHNKEKLAFHGMIGECFSKAKGLKLITKGPVGISKEEIWEQSSEIVINLLRDIFADNSKGVHVSKTHRTL